MAKRLWFGQTLWWGRENDLWYAVHAGRRFPIVRITRAEAEAYGRGTAPGWHLAEHPDEPGHGELGPSLGKGIRRAQELAEAWALAPATDRDPATYAPSLITTLRDGGAVFVDAAGQALAAYPVPWEAHVEIRDRRNDVVGRVCPWFQQGDDGDVTLQWIGKVGHTQLLAHPTFHAVCTEFGRVLAFGPTGGGRRGQ